MGQIRPGDDIGAEMISNFDFSDGDVAVVTQKIVSKAEGRILNVAEDDTDGFSQAVLKESKRILRRRGDLLITETNQGIVCANAGIDRSNNASGEITLLPIDPDRSARWIRARIYALTGRTIAVIVSDTFGRTWRNGVTDIALGIAGVAGVVNLKGTADANGKVLRATEVCIADEIAAAADLVKKKATNVPVAVVRGIDSSWLRESSASAEIVRDPSGDLFR